MTRNWHNPDRTPTPAELAAWADGELDAARAAQIESYLAAHPDAAAEVDANRRIVRLYRDHPPSDPSLPAWDAVRTRIAAGVTADARPRNPWRWPWFLALTLTAAAALGGVLLAGALLPWNTTVDETRLVEMPPGDENDEPFAVTAMRDVHIISMDARDADRLVMGRPILGPMEFVSATDIEVVKAEPNWEEGTMPKLQRGQEVPMIIDGPAEGDDDQT